MAVTVRWAELADREHAFLHERVPPTTLGERLASRRIAVAELDGQPVGGLQLDYFWGTIPYVALIRVAPDAQRHGVGRALLRFVEDALRGKGCERLYSSSQADEPAAQAWHRHVGFVECGFIGGINARGVGEVFFVKVL